MFKTFATLNPVEGVDIHAFVMENLRCLVDGFDDEEDVFEQYMLIALADGDLLKVVPTFLSPMGFTGFCYGSEEEVDNDEVDSDTYLETCEQMAAIIVATIKSHGGFNIIEVCGTVYED